MTKEFRSFETTVRRLQDEEFTLLVQRQEKYGHGNITAGGILGCIIRAQDKIERLKRVFPALGITGRGSGDFPDERVEDAMLDLANYGTIMLMLYRGVWGRPLRKDLPVQGAEYVADDPADWDVHVETGGHED